MKRLPSWLTAGALLMAGFVGGNVCATQAVAPFTKSTLARAMERLHSDYRANIIAVDVATPSKSFDVVVGQPGEMVASAAKQYGARAVDVGKVTVILDPLSAEPSGSAILANADAWLHHQPLGRILDSVNIRRASVSIGAGLGSQIGAAPVPFADLSAQQQSEVLRFVRSLELNQRSGSLRVLLSTSR